MIYNEITVRIRVTIVPAALHIITKWDKKIKGEKRDFHVYEDMENHGSLTSLNTYSFPPPQSKPGSCGQEHKDILV